MATADTLFFSYSRDDSEFVLNLATNLRKAGATVWLDQLDIKPGSHWDSSVEEALSEANTVLVILSCTSTKSNNVLDEVSYALEEDKVVVPVLLEECEIPFRLRRLQYADFTTDHNTGIETLINALSLERNVATKFTDVTIHDPSLANIIKKKTIQKEAKQATQAPKTSPPPQNTTPPKTTQVHTAPPKKKSNSTMYLVGCLIFMVVAAVIFIVILIAAYQDSNSDYDYLNDPTYTYDDNLNNTTTSTNSAEDIAWNTALNANTLEGYINFLYIYGKTTKYYTNAYKKMEAFLPNKAYVWYGVKGGKMNFSKYLYYSGDQNSQPQFDDIITPLFRSELYHGADYEQRGVYVQPGQRLMVYDVWDDVNNNIWVGVWYK